MLLKLETVGWLWVERFISINLFSVFLSCRFLLFFCLLNVSDHQTKCKHQTSENEARFKNNDLSMENGGRRCCSQVSPPAGYMNSGFFLHRSDSASRVFYFHWSHRRVWGPVDLWPQFLIRFTADDQFNKDVTVGFFSTPWVRLSCRQNDLEQFCLFQTGISGINIPIWNRY